MALQKYDLRSSSLASRPDDSILSAANDNSIRSISTPDRKAPAADHFGGTRPFAKLGMRQFIKRSIYFCLPILGLTVACDLFVSTQLKKSRVYASGEYPTWNAIYSGKMNCDIAIYGSSRACVQIDPSILSDRLAHSCYNFGIDGHNFWAQYFRHQQIIAYNRKPRIILQSLDMTTLTERGELFNADQFLPYMLFNDALEAFSKDYDVFHFPEFRLPLIRYAGKRNALLHTIKLAFTTQPTGIGRTKGFEGQDLRWNNDLTAAKNRFGKLTIKLDSGCVRLFEEYVRECANSDIRIFLVYSPEYVDGQHFVENRHEIIEIYRNLAARYNLPFLDYSSDPISFDRSYFYNASHLNKTGAEVFTNKLAGDLQELMGNVF